MDWLVEVKKAAKEVLSVLGEGYDESTYEEALAHELRLRKIPYERQRNFEMLYIRIQSRRRQGRFNPESTLVR